MFHLEGILHVRNAQNAFYVPPEISQMMVYLVKNAKMEHILHHQDKQNA